MKASQLELEKHVIEGAPVVFDCAPMLFDTESEPRLRQYSAEAAGFEARRQSPLVCPIEAAQSRWQVIGSCVYTQRRRAAGMQVLKKAIDMAHE